MARNPLLADVGIDQSPLLRGAPTLADAWSYNVNAANDWMQRERQVSRDRGLWTGGSVFEGGRPTQAGVLDAVRQFGENALLSAAAPTARLPSWFHGTAGKFDRFNTPEVYMTNSEAQAIKYAEGAHKPGSPGANDPRVLKLDAKPGEAQNIDPNLFEAMDDGLDLDDAILEAVGRARQEGKVRYLEYNHPNAGDQGEHLVRISLYPEADVAFAGDWLNLVRRR
jgi:hypothetical protein